ncbi:erythromycin esterase [Chitinophaga skermanii]|uniref:Erythromycin esterase n=1 Tax=Chitinophaga skermanii TaxID=331697 RepID=A0A327Q7A3_9BACT|nr:erythromycin esterase family protein [Chitinophaga skermanii]RAI99844.1 erythromycin esterase [Chitinophaga skermanii]
MKKLCFTLAFTAIISLFLQLPVIAQVKPLNPATNDFSALKSAIGNARIVLLGEQTHGEASTFEMKTQLIKYLHEEMNFDVLAFESGLFDCAEIWQRTLKGADFAAQLPGNLFYMYAGSQEMKPLFNYVQSLVGTPQQLSITGFDSQHSGGFAKKELFPAFEAFLQKRAANLLDSNFNTFKKVTIATINSNTYRPSEEEKKAFLSTVQRLKISLNGNLITDRMEGENIFSMLGFWNQVVASIESQALRYWQMVEGNEVSVRDLQMANNLIWLAEQAYPGKKIIVWAHNIHIAKNTDQMIVPNSPDLQAYLSSYKPMGETINRYFGKKAFTIGFNSSEGTFVNYTDFKVLPVPAVDPTSLEAKFAQEKLPIQLCNFHGLGKWWHTPQLSTLFDFVPVKADWSKVYDAILYIKTATPTTK